jgi:putative hydrolase of the HAD superfamily
MNNPRQIRWILFDIGGVLIEVDYRHTVDTLSEISGKSREEVQNFLLGSSEFPVNLAEKIGTGQIDLKTYLNHFCGFFQHQITPREVIALRQNELKESAASLANLLPKLKKHYHIACFSNSNVIHWQYLKQHFGFMKHFEFRMASHIAGYRKPDPQAWQYICNTLSALPGKILLIDDQRNNIDAAREFGFAAIHCEDPASLTQQITREMLL